MHSIGRIKEIWRYPISSIGGERIECASLSAEGVVGDRHYGLIDAVTGQPAAPEKHARWRKALYLQARSAEGQLPQLSFPDGRLCNLDDPLLNEALSDYLGFAAAIAVYPHFQTSGNFPLTQYRHPHFPVHLLTASSLRRLAELRQTGPIDAKRFRPTFLIEETEGSGFVEDEWIGRCLQIGAIRMTAEEKTLRCGMTFIAQPGVEEDPEILRNILRHNKRHFGICCTIEGRGNVGVGDELFIET